MSTTDSAGERPVYGTWIRRRKIVTFWLIASVCALLAGAAFLLAAAWPQAIPPGSPGQVALWVLAVLLAVVAVVFGIVAVNVSLVAWMFSPHGGDWQNRVHDLILGKVATSQTGERPRGLDIGCGNGNLVIKAARRFPEVAFTGIDYWGEDWEYSASRCQKNASLEKTANVEFQKASASSLPFESGSFDLVISCLTFHEVNDVQNRAVCLEEALRVLKAGGQFVLFDLFDDPGHWPDQPGIESAIRAAGGKISLSRPLSEEHALPSILNTGKALRFARIIVGAKSS